MLDITGLLLHIIDLILIVYDLLEVLLHFTLNLIYLLEGSMNLIVARFTPLRQCLRANTVQVLDRILFQKIQSLSSGFALNGVNQGTQQCVGSSFVTVCTDENYINHKVKIKLASHVCDRGLPENMIWATERIVSNVFIPLIKNTNIAAMGTDHLQYKVEKTLMPAMRSFSR